MVQASPSDSQYRRAVLVSDVPNVSQIELCGHNLRTAHIHQHGQSDELLVVEKVLVLTSWVRLTPLR